MRGKKIVCKSSFTIYSDNFGVECNFSKFYGKVGRCYILVNFPSNFKKNNRQIYFSYKHSNSFIHAKYYGPDLPTTPNIDNTLAYSGI